MKIPHTVSNNIFKLYQPTYETLYLKNELERKLYVENYDWDKGREPTLVERCLRVLINIFEKHQFLDEIPPDNANWLYENLETTLPLELTIPLIQADIYWYRSYMLRWKELNELTGKRTTWKVRYIERHIEEFLENIEPEQYVDEDYHTMWVTAAPYVHRLIITQLQQEKFRPAEEVTERELIHHINLRVLQHLTNVTELELVFGPRQIGEKFDFPLFKLSIEDCKNLASAIDAMPILTILRIHRSLLFAEHLRYIIKSIVTTDLTLTEIDFSHCKIDDRGANYLALLIKKHPALQILKIADNLITSEGATIISHVLQSTEICPLKHLDLRMNPIGPEGFIKLFSALIRNAIKPKELILAGIGITEEEAIIFGDIILPLTKSLEYLDISNNWCGVEGGKAIARGIEQNMQLTYLDLRNCGFSAESKFSIKKALHRNKCFNNKELYNEADVMEEDIIEIRSKEGEELLGDEEEEEEEEEHTEEL